VSATAGGSPASGVVTWAIGALPAGGAGSVQMTVRASASIQAGGTIINGTSTIGSNETATTTGYPAATTVVGAAAPAITSVVETGSSSIYLPRGRTWTIRVDGANFLSGASVDLGADISAGATTLAGTGRFTAPVTVLDAASLGPRTVTVNNPDGLSGSKPAALQVVDPPDIDRDCRIEASDLNLLARAWNTAIAEPGFDAAADLDGDDYVGPLDLAILAEYIGLRPPGCP
jgi:hypothetical protein